MDGMSEHLTTERISALLDEPWADMAAERHLESCAECRLEYERFSRVRMALSALGDLEPPAGEWEAIEARLDTSPFVVPIGGRRGAFTRAISSWPLQAAAAFTLFAGGVMAGLQITGGPEGETLAGALPVVDPPPAVVTGTEQAYLAHLSELNNLLEFRLADLESEDGTLDAARAARILARIDAGIQASQAALGRAPGDPVANSTLVRLVAQRDAVAGRVHRNAHLANAQQW